MPIKTFQKNVMAIRAHQNWLKVESGQSYLFCLYHPNNDFEKFVPLFEQPEIQTVEGVVLSTFDYSKISKTQILEDFEKADIFQIIDSMIEK